MLSPVLIAVFILVLFLLVFDCSRLPLVLPLLLPVDGLCLQLIEDVLDLPLELLIRVLHHIVQHFTHAQLVSLHFKRLTSED